MERLHDKKNPGKALSLLKLKIIDMYIIRKFLGTFFFCLILIMTIAVVFDLAEKIDNFMERSAPWKSVVFDYYLNFIPYFATLFAPLFVFISVIFFTSRMAVNTEIIAILNSGMSFRRMMWPYFLSSLVIAVFIFYLSNFVIPHSNLLRMDFEDKYYRSRSRRMYVESILRQNSKNTYVYMESYNPGYSRSSNFFLDKVDENGRLMSRLSALSARWDTATGKWSLNEYTIRNITGKSEVITRGSKIDTALLVKPSDFSKDPAFVPTITYKDLNDYIRLLSLQGSEEIKVYLVEKHRRIAVPFAVFILTLIGVTLSSRKVRGGIGMSIGIGLALSFSYILFLQFTSQFSLKGNLEPMLAMWIPNILYLIIALVLYRMAPK
jgi:lipopolysaccharide export system permease protein